MRLLLPGSWQPCSKVPRGAHDALGTKPSFDLTTGTLLKKFYNTWYAPNNAILVIAGNVDPQEILNLVKELFGSIPKKELPAGSRSIWDRSHRRSCN